MAASYPGIVRTFTPKVDFVDSVYAEHVNSLQDEVNSVESTLGVNPQTHVVWGDMVEDSFSTLTTFSSVKSRLDNIEAGVVVGVSFRVKTAGGSTISPASSVVGLKLQGQSGATGDLAQFTTQAGVKTTWVDKDGVLRTTGGSVSDAAITTSLLLGGM